MYCYFKFLYSCNRKVIKRSIRLAIYGINTIDFFFYFDNIFIFQNHSNDVVALKPVLRFTFCSHSWLDYSIFFWINAMAPAHRKRLLTDIFSKKIAPKKPNSIPRNRPVVLLFHFQLLRERLLFIIQTFQEI